MRKNRRKNNNQESREVLEQRLNDFINNNFRLLSEKQTLKNENLNLSADNESLKKENQNVKKMMKLNSLIMLLMMDFLNVCNEVENGWGFKRVISTYLSGIAQEMHQFPGDLNPAAYDPYNPIEDEDDVIDLDDSNEEI